LKPEISLPFLNNPFQPNLKPRNLYPSPILQLSQSISLLMSLCVRKSQPYNLLLSKAHKEVWRAATVFILTHIFQKCEPHHPAPLGGTTAQPHQRYPNRKQTTDRSWDFVAWKEMKSSSDAPMLPSAVCRLPSAMVLYVWLES